MLVPLVIVSKLREYLEDRPNENLPLVSFDGTHILECRHHLLSKSFLGWNQFR